MNSERLRAAIARSRLGIGSGGVAPIGRMANRRSRDLARTHAALGRFREAAGLLDKLPAADPTAKQAARLLRLAPAPVADARNSPYLADLSWVYLHVGAPDRALEEFEHMTSSGFFNSIACHVSCTRPTLLRARLSDSGGFCVSLVCPSTGGRSAGRCNAVRPLVMISSAVDGGETHDSYIGSPCLPRFFGGRTGAARRSGFFWHVAPLVPARPWYTRFRSRPAGQQIALRGRQRLQSARR